MHRLRHRKHDKYSIQIWLVNLLTELSRDAIYLRPNGKTEHARKIIKIISNQRLIEDHDIRRHHRYSSFQHPYLGPSSLNNANNVFNNKLISRGDCHHCYMLLPVIKLHKLQSVIYPIHPHHLNLTSQTFMSM